MNPWIPIIAQYGLEFALELAQILENKAEPTSEDFKGLITKYGTETLEQKAARIAATLPKPV